MVRPTISAAWISDNGEKFMATVEATVDATFLDTFLHRRRGARLKVRDHEREQAIESTSV